MSLPKKIHIATEQIPRVASKVAIADLTIIVQGPFNSGKSFVVDKIKGLLLCHNIEVTVSDE